MDSDPALGLPIRCCNCDGVVSAGAENVAGSADGTSRRRLVYAGSMSKKIVCRTCVEGGEGEGEVAFFPYVSDLLR